MASGNPIRHAIPWRADHFYDQAELDKELRRVLNVCHGCRRCFNLCETFPDLFAAVDAAPSQEMDTVTSAQVTDALNKCTLCDMCYLTKCPYVPPHPFNIDLPSLVVRQRAVANESQNAAASERVRDDASRPERLTGLYEVVEVAKGTSRDAKLKPRSWLQRVMLDTDRVGRMAGRLSALANWALDTRNALTRAALEAVAGIDRRAKLPPYVPTVEQYARSSAATTPASKAGAGPLPDARVVLFVGCLPNYSVPRMARAAQLVLEHNGVHVVPYYERCCGMPQLEQGLIKDVSGRAKATARDLQPYLEQGYTVVSLVSSCTLMLRQHWKLLAPEDDAVLSLATGTRDVCEYVNTLAQRRGGLASGLAPLPFGVALHQACHMRAQNVGAPSLQLLKAIPGASVASVDKCSGHGGSIGVSTEYHETARKLAEPAVSRVERARKQKGDTVVASDCPLACKHLNQVCGSGASTAGGGVRVDESGSAHVLDAVHPIELVALSYGLVSPDSLPLPRVRARGGASE